MVKVSDLIAEYLKEQKIETVFGIIGSANAHIFDSINKLGYTTIINTHHEQAAVMAMGAYYRTSGKLSAAIVTAGGGASNAITGVVSNWADSIPGIIISGQESSFYVEGHSDLRMYGTQGFNVSKMVEDITKYSTVLLDETQIQNEIEKCHNISIMNRPGPCWLDIPFNIQSKMVEKRDWNFTSYVPKEIDVEYLIDVINSSNKPIILGGHGVRLSGAKEEFNQFVNTTKIPTTLTWSGIDLLESNNPNFYGRFGLYGQRGANFIIQNSDLVIVLGSRLALPQSGYDFSQFARDAKIVVVDIEDILQIPQEKIDKHYQENCKDILISLNGKLSNINPVKQDWINFCNKLRTNYPWIGPEHDHTNNYINSYQFIDKLSDHLKDDHVIVTDMGTALLSGHQSIKLKPNQKMFTSLGLGEMGYGLPGALGAAAACPDKDILCMNCDGGIMMNLQELHTILENGFNVKVIIFNNDGYLMIKHTQKLLFNNHYVSVDKETGIGLPNFSKLLPAFGYDYFSLKEWDATDDTLDKFLNNPNSAVLEVFMDPEQNFLPKVKGVPNKDGSILAPPIEEMSPLLPLEEVKNNLLIKLSEKSKLIER